MISRGTMKKRRANDTFLPESVFSNPVPSSPVPRITHDPALGIIELISIARGIFVCDSLPKKAPINILEATPICSGKYMVIISGEVGPVEESMAIGVELAGEFLVDKLFLPQVDLQVPPAIVGTTRVESLESLGIVECFSVASAIVSADAAAKAARVTLLDIRLANGLGGKGFFTLTGDLNEVIASVEAGAEMAKRDGMLVNKEIIPSPHRDIAARIL